MPYFYPFEPNKVATSYEAVVQMIAHRTTKMARAADNLVSPESSIEIAKASLNAVRDDIFKSIKNGVPYSPDQILADFQLLQAIPLERGGLLKAILYFLSGDTVRISIYIGADGTEVKIDDRL